MDHCLTYFSTAVGLLSEEDLTDILTQSRHNNARLGITGVLLYVRGSIIQVLEGEQQALEALYKHIQEDPRHKNVTTVINRSIAQRLFGQWSMGYETLTTRQLEEIHGLINLEDNQSLVSEAGEPVILKMIRLFYESNRRN